MKHIVMIIVLIGNFSAYAFDANRFEMQEIYVNSETQQIEGRFLDSYEESSCKFVLFVSPDRAKLACDDSGYTVNTKVAYRHIKKTDEENIFDKSLILYEDKTYTNPLGGFRIHVRKNRETNEMMLDSFDVLSLQDRVTIAVRYDEDEKEYFIRIEDKILSNPPRQDLTYQIESQREKTLSNYVFSGKSTFDIDLSGLEDYELSIIEHDDEHIEDGTDHYVGLDLVMTDSDQVRQEIEVLHTKEYRGRSTTLHSTYGRTAFDKFTISWK